MSRPNLALVPSAEPFNPDALPATWSSYTEFQERVCAQRPALVARGLMLTSSAAAADDLAQDTIERTLRAGPGRMGPEHLHQWMMVVLRNQFVCEWRSGRRMLPLDLEACEELMTTSDEPPAPAWTAFTAEDVRTAVATLTPGLRRTFELHAFDGLPYQTIARLMGIPVGTVGTRLLRARKQLKAALERAHAGTPEVSPRRCAAPLIDDAGDATRPLLRIDPRVGGGLHARSAG